MVASTLATSRCLTATMSRSMGRSERSRRRRRSSGRRSGPTAASIWARACSQSRRQRASKRRRSARTRKGLTAEQRVLRSRLGAYRLHATHNPKETTKKAREAFARRFEREVDPDGVLAPAERSRRVEAARRAYFTRLALRSSQARRQAG